MISVRSLAAVLIIGTHLAVAANPAAGAALKVEIGWGGSYRVGRWAPVFVTASDAQPRNVRIELYVPFDQLHPMRIEQIAGIGPMPTTFVLYAPLRAISEDLSVTLRDPQTDRLLASTLWNGMAGTTGQPWTNGAASQLIAISGGRAGSAADRSIEHQFYEELQVTCRWMDPMRLPTTAIGYDSLNLLVLDRPDLAGMPGDQQEAIVNWVRAGGQLLCWIGADALPASSPILDALPAAIGENGVIDVSPDTIARAGLSSRFQKLPARHLTPRPDAERISLLGNEAHAYRQRFGFGAITILSFDATGFYFNDPRDAHSFWRPVLRGIVQYRDEGAGPNKDQPFVSPYNSMSESRRAMAASAAMNSLGDIPGAGTFGFSYVAILMIGMMLVVGPIDWIVLKRLDRQPWTWITTGGWIGLITISAVYAGYLFKSGDLHFRTLRLIDQADGMTVATADAIGIYSPRTQDYRLKTDPDSWWQPLSAESYVSRSSGLSDLYFHQDQHGTRPMPVRISVWNMKFLIGQNIEPAAAVIEASLHKTVQNGQVRLAGSITNRSNLQFPMFSIRNGALIGDVRTPVPPGGTIDVDIPLSAEQSDFRTGSVWNLIPDRNERIIQILDTQPEMAQIFTICEGSNPTVTIDRPPNAQKHGTMIRALIKLEQP